MCYSKINQEMIVIDEFESATATWWKGEAVDINSLIGPSHLIASSLLEKLLVASKQRKYGRPFPPGDENWTKRAYAQRVYDDRSLGGLDAQCARRFCTSFPPPSGQNDRLFLRRQSHLH